MTLKSSFGAIILSILVWSSACAATPATVIPPDGYIEVGVPVMTRSHHGVFEFCTRRGDSPGCAGEWLAAEKYVQRTLKVPAAKYVGMSVSDVPDTRSCGHDCVETRTYSIVRLFYKLPSAR